MPVYAVWESYFPPEAAQAGRAITEAIWRDDMPRFDGYVAHELIEDLDDPGHLLSARTTSCVSTQTTPTRDAQTRSSCARADASSVGP